MKKSKTKPAVKRSVRRFSSIPEPLPEWMDGTPTMLYTLEAFHEQTRQEIRMTLEEYNALKLHLCILRGITVPAAEATNAN
ncbi:MAG: hypothetical protein M3O20_05570 [Acidobacteriota bacterium]|nr:hypothetical protein [Acidobacteriota bacterium]